MGVELLDQVIAAHGGLERFQAADEVVARVASGGFLLATRCRRGVARDLEIRCATTRPHTVLAPYPRPGQRGIFDGADVRIESDAGEVLRERRDARTCFPSLRRNVRWDDLDLLYFAGYANWNYLTCPFLLARPGVGVEETDPWVEDGERLRRLLVRFPADVPTHCAEQRFAFDDGGRLRRLEYTADVIGSWARAVHYASEYRTFDGLPAPTRRRVYPRARSGRPRPWPLLVSIDVAELALA